jgi:hypothetical protein
MTSIMATVSIPSIPELARKNSAAEYLPKPGKYKEGRK